MRKAQCLNESRVKDAGSDRRAEYAAMVRDAINLWARHVASVGLVWAVLCVIRGGSRLNQRPSRFVTVNRVPGWVRSSAVGVTSNDTCKCCAIV